MNVAELIERLRTFPSTLPVRVRVEEGEDCDVSYVGFHERAQTDLRPQDTSYVEIY
jgi:hypothetical protein